MNELNAWLTEFKTQHKTSTDLLEKACDILHHAEPKPIPYAESSIALGLSITRILAELNCDQATLVSALIYPSVHYNVIKIDVAKTFNPQIEKLTQGVIRLEALHNIHRNLTAKGKQIDNFRKMFLAVAEDIRIVLIKIAENLALLQQLRKAPKIQQRQVAKQTSAIYAPLANRLGMGQIKWQLEDFAFRYLHPDKYQAISKALNSRRQDREDFIQHMIKTIQELLTSAEIKNTSVTGRAKHIYSIYRKMDRKNIDFTELYDTSAVRVLVPSIQDCYTILGLVHTRWKHVTKEFDDYIAKPKPNGYRSIHTCVIESENRNVEIQIRTEKMHAESELGVAAHWKYKETDTAKSSYEDKINWLRQMMTWQQDPDNNDEENETGLLQKIFADRIYVFTPSGEILDLPAGATPVDFAYHVHTEVGSRCKGAKINGKLVTLSNSLKTGDQVEIITAKEAKPSRDWLNDELGYLTTKQARNKVRAWFKKQEHHTNRITGETIWEKAARREGLLEANLNTVLKHFNLKHVDDLMSALGANHLSAANIVQQLKIDADSTQNDTDAIGPKLNPIISKSQTTQLKVKNADNLLTKIAGCCKPIPGDDIIGYITQGQGVSIHQVDCHNAERFIKYNPERIIEMNWDQDNAQAYEVDLAIEAADRNGLVRDITAVISHHNMPIAGLMSRKNRRDNAAYINITIEINKLEPLQKLLNELRQLEGVTKASRI